MSITEFLLARIAEDEEIAAYARCDEDRWSAVQKRDTLMIDTGPESMGWTFGGGSGVWNCDDPEDGCWLYQACANAEGDHIARFDPTRIVAECEAKRRIVEHHACVPDSDGPDAYNLCAVCSSNGPEARGWPCDTLRLLALPYADHPDFDEEWRI